jgi:hypothetical protein
MPRRSKITQLPPEIKEKLDRLLIERGFSGYDGMADEVNAELEACGLEITVSRSGLHRYGQEFENKIAAIKIATEQAKAITEAVGDDADKVGQSLTALCQEKAYQVLLRMGEIDPESVDFNKLTVAISKLNKTAVDQKKWAAESRKKPLEDAADAAEKTAKQEGVSQATIEKIRRDVLMMAG